MSKLVNIITRTHERPGHFAVCRQSIDGQTHKRINHIVGTDVPCDYYDAIQVDTDIKPDAKPEHASYFAPWNCYLNQLAGHVEDGWVIYLDDDDMFATERAIEKIVNNIDHDDQLLMWRVDINGRVIPSGKGWGKVILCDCTSSGFAFHSKHLDKVRWTSWDCGDYRVFKELSEVLEIKLIDQVLTKTQGAPNRGNKPKLQLPDVTLVCVDDYQPDEALKAIEICMGYADFYDVKFFTSDKNYPHAVPTVVQSKEEYCRFLVKELHKHVRSSHCLIVQHDGYILNPDAWTDDFLKYDYIGAPWRRFDRHDVGNGGFSLRSKKFLRAGSKLDLEKYMPEDFVLCNENGDKLEGMGIKIAPKDVAEKFAIEHGVWSNEFGFHDFKTDISNHEH
jgi:hypothetical protein